jgi:predicted TIM-barrel fold metal-dependent hydrolase
MERRRLLSLAGLAAASLGSRAIRAAEESPCAGAGGAPADEPALEPELAIVDAHHHLLDVPAAPGRAARRYLLPELMNDIELSGHRITHTVFAECHAMYRADGPESLKPVGETEFVNGIAAMSASGRYGRCRVAAAIIGSADLRLGAAVRPVLEAQMRAGNGRFRGIRIKTAYAELPIFGQMPDPAYRGLLSHPKVREAAATLGEMGLTWDVWVFHTQLAELVSAADAVPGCTIVLNHLGSPLDIGPYRDRREAVFRDWQASVRALAQRPNVYVKLGGLGPDFAAPVRAQPRNAGSATLAAEWRPWIEAAIEAFGPARCMFESNFPPNAASGRYGATWNAFKRITSACSAAEKAALYAGTARRLYRISEAQT